MPRPCAVESHVRRYKEHRNPERCHGLAPWCLTFTATKAAEPSRDATALRRGVSRSPLQKPRNSQRCHGLAPWCLTFAATKAAELSEMPRPCAVVSHARLYKSRGTLRD